jgi:biopolymer transport protein ExbD
MRRKVGISIQDSSESELINLTPLLDVLFVVLILFILLAPFFHIDHIELTKHLGVKKSEYAVKRGDNLHLSIDKNGGYYINNQQTPLEQIKHKLLLYKANHPNAYPELFPDQNAPFISYQTLKTLLEEIGYDQLDIVLQNTSQT